MTLLNVSNFLNYYAYIDMEQGNDVVNIDEKNLCKLLQHIVNKLEITDEDFTTRIIK